MRWILGILLLLLAALLLESGLLAYAAYVLVLLMVIGRLLTQHWISSLHATRYCKAEELEVGDTAKVKVKIENHSYLPIPWVLLEDLLPVKGRSEDYKRVAVKRKRMQVSMIGAQGEVELDYEIRFRRRGYYQIGPLVMETGDLFGLHRRYKVGTEPHYVLVYPQVVPLDGYEISSRKPLGEIQMTHRLYEDPTRIAGVRQYQTGDPLNRMHWKTTARTGMLHCKIYDPSTIAGATIVVDMHEDGYPAKGEPDRSELVVTTAASLAFALHQMSQQVGLITNGRDAADRIRQEGWDHDYRTRKQALQSAQPVDESERLQPVVVPTRRGVEQFPQIWRTLARAELSDGLTLSQLIVETANRMPRDATVIAILPSVPVESALALGNLVRRGYAVTAVLVLLDDGDRDEAIGRLMAERIEVRYVRDDDTLAAACQKQVLV